MLQLRAIYAVAALLVGPLAHSGLQPAEAVDLGGLCLGLCTADAVVSQWISHGTWKSVGRVSRSHGALTSPGGLSVCPPSPVPTTDWTKPHGLQAVRPWA